ncbi:MAG: hypothetical protein AAF368_19795, partial [Planctomycetota bacterium]
ITAQNEAVFLSREPSKTPESVASDALWDGRWRLETPVRSAETHLGALETAGLQALATLERQGLWTPPARWKTASRAARRVSPALWSGETLLAAPFAGHGNVTAFDAIAADLGLETAPVGHVCSR